jgi:thiosulfate dehydrogenase [quinone] large subunit
MPHILVLGFAYTIPFIEAVLGIALVLGTFTRVTLGVASLFMMMLTLGVTANQQWDIAGQQLLYSLVLFVLLFLHEHNDISLDNAL